MGFLKAAFGAIALALFSWAMFATGNTGWGIFLALLAVLTPVMGLDLARQRGRFYDEAAGKLNAGTPEAKVRGMGPGLAGEVDGFRVVAEDYSEGESSCTRVTVSSLDRAGAVIDSSITIGAEKTAFLPKVLRAGDLQTGDEEFDGKFFLEGPPERLLARLVPETREALLHFEERGAVSVGGGRVYITRLDMMHKADDLVETVRRAARLARHLASFADAADELEHNARNDPSPSVRAHNLEALFRHFPDRPAAMDTVRTLMTDPDPEVRLAAVKLAGDEGLGALRELFSDLLKKLKRPLSGQEKVIPFEIGGRHILEDIERGVRREEEIAAETLLLLMSRHPPAGAAHFVRGAFVAARTPIGPGEGPLREAALDAAGKLGDPSFEEEAVASLSSGSRQVGRAAVRTLSLIGTAAAVAPLRALAKETLLDFGLKADVTEAVGRIQSRLTGADAGQVSLAAGEAGGGRVSIAGPEGEAQGRVSLDEGGSGRRRAGRRARERG